MRGLSCSLGGSQPSGCGEGLESEIGTEDPAPTRGRQGNLASLSSSGTHRYRPRTRSESGEQRKEQSKAGQRETENNRASHCREPSSESRQPRVVNQEPSSEVSHRSAPSTDQPQAPDQPGEPEGTNRDFESTRLSQRESAIGSRAVKKAAAIKNDVLVRRKTGAERSGK